MTHTMHTHDVASLRARARLHIDRCRSMIGDRTAAALERDRDRDGGRDRDMVLELLNAALAIELLALLRCKRHYYSARGASEEIRHVILEHAAEESMHTDRLAGRIVELGGLPDFGAPAPEPPLLEIAPLAELEHVIREDLAAQRAALEHHRDIIACLAGLDDATSGVLRDIVESDQRYIERLARHLEGDAGAPPPAAEATPRPRQPTST